MKSGFKPATGLNYSLLLIGELERGNIKIKILYKSRPSQPVIIDFLINQRANTLHNVPMDMNDQYTYEIQHDIAFLLYRKGKLLYSEPIADYIFTPDDIEGVHESLIDDSDKY